MGTRARFMRTFALVGLMAFRDGNARLPGEGEFKMTSPDRVDKEILCPDHNKVLELTDNSIYGACPERHNVRLDKIQLPPA